MNKVMHNSVIERIIILGAGLTGWTVAAGLAKGLAGLPVKIVLVDDIDLREQDACCEASMPSVHAYHQHLGINETDLISATGSSYTLATEYSNWSYPEQDYFLPFSDHGFMLQRMEFAQYFVSQAQVNAANYDAYSLSAKAASLGRFRHPSKEPSSLLSTLAYGLQIDCENYTNYLITYAKTLGVDYVRAKVIAAGVAQDTGALTFLQVESDKSQHLLPDDQGKIQGDFFIDCSGQQAWLRSQLGRTDFQPCPYLLADAALSLCEPTGGVIPSSVKLSHDATGWHQKIHTQNLCENRYFFNSSITEPEHAAQILSHASGPRAVNLHIQFNRPGNISKPWFKNCLAIGQAAGYAENFVVGKLHLVQSAVLRLLKLFPASVENEWQPLEYNRLTQAEFDHIVDFHSLHYQLVHDKESPFCRAAIGKLSDRLSHKLMLFRERATIPFYENETVSTGMWVSLLLGCHYKVDFYNPLIDSVDAEWVKMQLKKMQSLMAQAAETMPSHAEYLAAVTKNNRVAR